MITLEVPALILFLIIFLLFMIPYIYFWVRLNRAAIAYLRRREAREIQRIKDDSSLDD